MKKSRISICMVYVLVMALLLSQFSFVYASGDKIDATTKTSPTVSEIILAVEPLLNAQKQHYDIRKVSALNLTEPKASGNNFVVECDIVLYMTLKYSKMEELPHIAGLLSTAGYDTVEECRAVAEKAEATVEIANELSRSSTATRASIAAAEKLVSESITAVGMMDFVESVADTFGEEIELTFPVTVTTDAQGLILSVEGRNDENDTTFLLSNFFPQSNAQMYANGVSQAENLIATASTSVSSRAIQIPYYRVDARDYANRYTSNATNYCPHGKVKMNTAYYNLRQNETDGHNSSEGYNYFCHADCANYVSQAIRYGGISTNDVWYPYSYAWCNVRGLYNFFVRDYSYALASNFASCAAGGFIITYDTEEKSMNHVVMCVLNDTVNHAYSAHTTDKRQCAYDSNYPNYGDGVTEALYFYFRVNDSGTQYGSDLPIAP